MKSAARSGLSRPTYNKFNRRAAPTSGDHALIERPVKSSEAMSEASRREVRAGLEASLARLWRYALMLSKARDVADDLVQATCLRAIERADQFVPGTRVDRWLFAILRSIWLNEIRSQRIREGGGVVDAADALTTDGEREIEMNITASAVLRAIDLLPEAQRETVLLVYGEGYSYAEAAAALGVPIGTIMSRLAAGRAALARLK
jgi:RNA polymerase sigma-70 factor (ECF subfamily)